MKNFNLIEKLQGCSKRNGTTFRQSNPDGQPTVNRQSRLMSHQGYLKSLAMIFAVLVLSMANVGTAWGQTKVSTSNFYKLYADSEKDYSTLVSGASFPAYIGNTFNANMNGKLSSVPSISTPHNFAGLNTDTKYYRIKMASSKTLTLTNVANVKKVTFYGNGSSSTRTISVSVAKVSGSGSTFSVTSLSLANSNATIVAYATEDFTGKSGYDANTYYTYTFTASGDVSLWGIYVECGETSTPRTFNSGQEIFFKDASGNITWGDLNKQWVSDGGHVYAYFWNDTENDWSAAGTVVSGSDGAANAIYKITVPGSGKEYTKVLFTRGNAGSWGGKWNQTTDQTPAEGYNMFCISNDGDYDEGRDPTHKWKGTWSKYGYPAALVGDFNNWSAYANVFPNSGTSSVLLDDLAASTSYKFKVLQGESYCGVGSGTITGTTNPWWHLDGANDVYITTGTTGRYTFAWNTTTYYLGVYYPGGVFAKNKYIYFDVTDETYWNANAFTARFYFKYVDSGSDLDDQPVECSTPLENYVYYAVVPNSDYAGQIQMNRYYNSGVDGTSNICYAYSRGDDKKNCMTHESGKENYKDSWTPQWTTYCPPMTKPTLTDNNGSTIYAGNGTSGNPYIVGVSTSISVSASASTTLDDPDMTAMYDFKAGGTSQQDTEGTTYTFTASSSDNTSYTLTVDAYNTYNSTNSTKKTSDALYYKARTLYTITYNKGSYGTGDNVTEKKAKAVDITLRGVTFTRTGYTQTGWNKNSSGSGGTHYDLSASYTSNSDLTIYPEWTAKTTSVTLNPNTDNHGTGTNVVATATFDGTALSGFTAATPASGYALEGYYTGATSGDKILNADGSYVKNTTYTTNDGTPKWKSEDASLTLYAHYVPTYTVTYKKNGGASGADGSVTGTTTDASSPYASGSEVTGLASGFTNSGYKFKWWNKNYGGDGMDVYAGEKFTISANTNLYAQWEQVASGWAFWCGDAMNATYTDISGNGVTMRLTRTNVDYNTNLADGTTEVNKQSSVMRHAKVLAIDTKNTDYLTINFTGGEAINSLELGVCNKGGTKEMLVIYSTTADFSSGEGEKVALNTKKYDQSTKAVYDFSPSTANKYLYARVYMQLDEAVYDQTGGSNNIIRIYSIKAQAGSSCSAPTSPEIDGETSYTAGEDIELTASATGTSASTTYAWYLGDPEEDGEEVQAASTSGATFSKSAVVADNGNTYYCVISNGDGCDVTTSQSITVSCATAPVAVSSLTCSSKTTTSLTYTWTKASNASGYTATLYSDSDCKSQVASQSLGDVATVTFSTLSVGTTYYCKVQSKGNGTVYCVDGGTTSALSGTTLHQYTISYNAGTGGSGSVSGGTKTEGTAFTLSSEKFTRSGYVQTGWTTSDGGTQTHTLGGSYTTDAAQTFYPVWSPVYTVTFNTNGTGSVSPITQTTYGGSISMPSGPSSTDSTFLYWVIGGNTYAASASYTPTSNITAYAAWKEKCSGGSTEIRFLSSKNDSGNAFASMSTSSNTTDYAGEGVAKLIAIGSAPLENSENDKRGFRSEGKLDVVFKLSATSTLTIYVNQNGSSSRSYQLEGFSSVKSLTDIGTSDYSSGTSIVTSNITVTGDNFTGTSQAGSGSASSGVITISSKGGLKIIYSSLAAGYYVFKSTGSSSSYIWGFDLSGGSGGTCYYVKYDGNGAESGSINDATAYTSSSSTVTVLGNTGGSAFVKDGYTFTGWNTAANGSGDSKTAGGTFTITKDTVLYAQWLDAATTYTVSITADPDGYGSVSSSSVTSVASGTSLSTSTNTLSVGATNVTATAASASAEYTYAFDEWTLSDGTALPSTVTEDLSVYANFTRTANSYTLAWSSNGGSDLSGSYTSGSTAYGASITAPTDPTLSNYTFDGWKTNNDGTGTAKGSTMPAANTTYYAAWKQTVTLTTGAQGSGDNQTPYVYLNGTGVSSFTAHTASGYSLQGYYTAGNGGVKVLNANGTFASANVDGYITSSKWSRTGAAPTLYAQWVASEDCSTSDFVIRKGSSTEYQGCMESTSYDGTATSFTAGSATTVGNAKMTISSYSKGAIARPGSGNTFSIVIEPVSGYYLKSICWAGKVESGETVSYYWDDDSESATTISAQTTSGTGVTYNAPSSTTKFTASYVDDGEDGGGIWWRNVQVEVCADGGTTYNVTYDGNDETSGSVPTDDTDYSYGDAVTVLGNTGSLAKTNYTFAGWTTNDDGTGSNYVADNTFSITDNTTLYAKWTQAVTFDANTANHGSTGGSATAVWNATGLTGITHATPASGYKLTGYYTEATAGTKVLNSDGSFAGDDITDWIDDGKWVQNDDDEPLLYAQYESAGALTWNLVVKSDTSALSTSTKTSAFTEISTTNMTNAAIIGGLGYTKSSKSSLTGKIGAPTSLDAAKYVKVTFQVASGYKFTPSSIKVPIQPVSGAADVKLVLVDNAATPDSIGKVQASLSKGSITTVEMTNGSSVEFTGTVTLKIYCYGSSTETYRLGTPITIEGEIEETCATMPSYKSMSYTTTSFAPDADASGSPITIVGGENINTYQWKYNTVNDRTSGTNCGTGTSLTPLTDASATTDGTRYYWCEMTNDACGITIKSPAVAITVAAAKSDATVTWTGPASTPNYGGGGYTIKATVDQTGWDGNEADLVITAPAGIRIYNVSSGTTSSQKWVQADFDVQTSFDRSTYASNIPFTVSAAATATYNAISDEEDVDYSACTGGSASEELMPVNADSVNSTVKGWRFAGTGKMWYGHGSSTPSTGSSNIKSLSNTMAEGNIDHYYNTGGSYFSFYTEKAITGVRLYVYTSNSNVEVSNVYIANSQFATGTPSSGAVTFDVVYNDDNEGLDKGDDVYSAWAEITFDSEVAAGKYGLIKLDNNVKIAGIGLISTSGGGATLNTYLQWSGDLADDATVAKYTTDAYFTYSASKITSNTNTLGAITYSSSNTSVATVDATGKVALVAAGSTTIKATLAASGCYKKAEISYTLNVTEVPCAITAGTLTLTSGTESKCSSDNVTLTLTGFESGASIQWKDGDTDINNGGNYTIETDGTTSTLTTDQEGTYSVMVTSDCSVRSNRITISNKSTEVGAKRIVKNWYIKNGRLTPDIELWTLQNGAHLSSVAWSPANATGLTASDFYESDGKVYLKGKEPSSNTSGADITYTLTLTVEDDCGSTTDMSASGQLIYLHHQQNTDKHVLAFVVSGTDKGGFTEGITAAQTTSVPLYNEIAENFDVLATNIKSTDDEQALKEYYSQFDILCVTDYPNTEDKGVNKKSYVDALGALVDIRPILTMEAWVSKLANWKAKGISGTPKSPTTRQYTMLLQCKDHEIFSGTELTKVGEGDETMYRISMVCDTLEDYKTLDATYGAGTHEKDKNYQYGKKPALQGFTFDATMADDGLLPLGLIEDGSGNDLQVGIERQTKMEARLMVLGINSYAMERLTDDGQTVVVNALKYLMKKNSEEIADCSNTFVGGDDEEVVSTRYNWDVASHWSGNAVPDRTQKVRIVAPCVIPANVKPHVTGVIIAPIGKYNKGANTANGSLTIAAGGVLIVDGQVEAATAPNYNTTRATSPSDLIIRADEEHQGALIFDNNDGETQATVEMYSPSYWETVEGKKKKYWSYVGVPIQEVDIPNYFYLGFTYLYDETSGWIKKGDGSELHPFEGIGLSMQSGHKETFYGTLASTETREITLTKTPDVGNGENLIGNSWTAPIQIANFDASDFGEATATVYVYNTGRDAAEGGSYGGTGSTTAGQWVSVPVETAKDGAYDGLKVIPAMNAFQVNTTTETTLTLDYDKLVRGGATSAAVGDLTVPLRAPKQSPEKAQNSIEAMMRVRVSGEKTHTDVWLQQDERFTEEFDNGWEAKYAECDNRSAQFYAQSEIGKMAFLALPDLEGTILGFVPNRDGNDYTFTFHYVGDEEFYLNDLKQKTSTLISEDATYSFTYGDGDTNRFYISRTPIDAPQTSTGVDNTGNGEVKARKFIYRDKMYIMINGRVYSADGALVK